MRPGSGPEHDRCFRCGYVETERLFEVEADHLVVVGVIADRQILAAIEHEIASSQAEDDRASHAGRPHDRTFEDLAEVLKKRVPPVLGGLDDKTVVLGS